MVKGVNKKVIEINNTENELFEKIVLYVSPKAGAANSAKVRRAVKEVVTNLSGDFAKFKSLRELLVEKKKRKTKIIIFSSCFALLIAAVVTMFIL